MLTVGGCGSADPVDGPSPTSAAAHTDPSGVGATRTPQVGPEAGRTAVPPYVAAATWVRGSGGLSLHVEPTAAGRTAQGADAAAEAWHEVLVLAPDADRPGMRAQFDCHWAYARVVQPDKPSWNLEPWRPVVSEQQLVDARCNPGGPEAADG